MTNIYDQGNTVRLINGGGFQTIDGDFLDPDEVYFVCLKADGTTYLRAHWTAGGGSVSTDGITIVHDGTGLFHCDVSVDVSDAPGLWQYRWYSTGNGQASYRNSFEVAADTLV